MSPPPFPLPPLFSMFLFPSPLFLLPSLSLFLSQLSVSDSKLKEFHESVMEDAKTKAKKANVISLAVSQ